MGRVGQGALPDMEWRARQSVAFTACQSTLEVLLAGGLHADIVCSHPVYDIWVHVDQLIPDCAPHAPEETLEACCFAWRLLSPMILKKQTSVFPSNDTASYTSRTTTNPSMMLFHAYSCHLYAPRLPTPYTRYSFYLPSRLSYKPGCLPSGDALVWLYWMLYRDPAEA